MTRLCCCHCVASHFRGFILSGVWRKLVSGAIEHIFLLSCLPILSPSSFVSWCGVIRKLISRTQHCHCKWVASNKTPLAVCLFWACTWSLCRYSTSWGRQLKYTECIVGFILLKSHDIQDWRIFHFRNQNDSWMVTVRAKCCSNKAFCTFCTYCIYCICRLVWVSEKTAVISGNSTSEIRNREALCFLEEGWICRSVQHQSNATYRMSFVS